MRKKIESALMIVVILSLAVFYFQQQLSEKRIQKHRRETVGVIIDYYVIFPESHYLTYEYNVSGVIYRKRTSTSIVFPHCIEDSNCFGRKFLVIYEKDNPANSVIDLKSPK